MIRLGVIGLGARISSVIGVLKELSPEVHVVGVIDPDEAGARTRLAPEDGELAVFYATLDALMRAAKVDALLIGTRCPLHTPYAIQVAGYEVPLFLEKPVAISMEQAIALEEAFTRTRCQVVVSFPLRVTPLCEMTRQLIEEGAVGAPEHILGINYVPYGITYFGDDAYRHYAVTQGLFLQKATHDLDYMCYLMGSPIVRVAAMASCGRVFGGDKQAGLRCSACAETESCPESPENRARNGSGWPSEDHYCVYSVDCGTPEQGMNEDSSSALLQFASGAQGVYTQVFFTHRDAGRRGATVSGFQGTLAALTGAPMKFAASATMRRFPIPSAERRSRGGTGAATTNSAATSSASSAKAVPRARRSPPACRASTPASRRKSPPAAGNSSTYGRWGRWPHHRYHNAVGGSRQSSAARANLHSPILFSIWRMEIRQAAEDCRLPPTCTD